MAFEYFSLSELRGQSGLADTVQYPDAKLSTAHDWIAAIIEREIGASFVARATIRTLDGNSQDCRGGLMLPSRHVLAVTAVTSNGVAFTAPQLAEIQIRNGHGMGAKVYRRAAGLYGAADFTAWDAGVRNIVVTYNGGWSTAPPADVKDAALQGARDRVLRTSGTGLSDRTQSVTDDQGTRVLAAPGTNRPTGLPEVDAVIMGWAKKLRPRWSVG